MSTVRAIAASPGRSRSKRPTNSAAKCWASAAEPPLPQASTLPPPVMQPTSALTASAIGLLSTSAAAYLRSALSKNCCWIRCSSMVTDDMTRVLRVGSSPFTRRRRPRAATRSARLRPLTTSKRQGGSVGSRREEVARREDQPALLAGVDRRRGAAVAGVGPRPDLDEHQRAVAVAQDQVDLAAARARSARHPIIALDRDEPVRHQVGERSPLGIVASSLGRPQVAQVWRRRSWWSRIVRCSSRRRPPRPPASSIPRRRSVRRRHADRQPRRPQLSRPARAGDGRRDRLRGHPAQRPAARALRPDQAAARRSTSTTSATPPAPCSPGWPRRTGRLHQRRRHAGGERPGRGAGRRGARRGLSGACRSRARAARWPPCRSPAIRRGRRLRRRRLPAGARRRARASAGAVRRRRADPGAVRGAAPHRGARRRARRGLPAARRSPSAASSPSSSRPWRHLPAPASLPAWLAADPNRPRGEFVVVLHALADADAAAGRRRSRCTARAAAGRAAAEAGGGAGRGDRRRAAQRALRARARPEGRSAGRASAADCSGVAGSALGRARRRRSARRASGRWVCERDRLLQFHSDFLERCADHDFPRTDDRTPGHRPLPAARALRPQRGDPGQRAGDDRDPPHRRRRPLLPVHAQRGMEPGGRHRQERQLRHRPGRRRARGRRREDRLRLFRRHLRGGAARRRAHRAHHRRGRAEPPRQAAAGRSASPAAACSTRRWTRSPPSTAPRRSSCWRRSSGWRGPAIRASSR